MSDVVREWLVALGIVGAAFVVGFAIDRILIGVLRHGAGPAQRARGALARALAWQSEIWVVLLAVATLRPFDHVATKQLWWLDKLTVLLAILSVTMFLARLASWLIKGYLAKDTVAAPSGSIFVNLTRVLIWVVGLTVMLGALEVQIGPLVASLGVVGLAVSLGLQDTLANFFGGLQITMSRQIQPGQYIRLSTGEEGSVVDVTWRNTTLCAPSNDFVIVPNSVIARAHITNFTADSEEHVSSVPLVVKYGSDLREVERIALATATEVRDEFDNAIKEFEPTCRFRAFAPEGITTVVTIRVERYQERVPIVSALVERLYERLGEAGIELSGIEPPPARK